MNDFLPPDVFSNTTTKILNYYVKLTNIAYAKLINI